MDIQAKRCERCGEEKSFSEFGNLRSQKSKGMYEKVCRPCFEAAQADPSLKRCNRCASFLPLSSFDHRSGHRSHQLKAWCRECSRTYGNWFMNEVYKKDPEAWMEKQRARHAADPSGWLFQAAKRRARNNGIEFSITRGDIIIPQKCPLLGIELKVARDHTRDCSPTLDRIDNFKGYIPGNVWVISHKANTAKNNLSIEELELLVSNLRRRLG